MLTTARTARNTLASGKVSPRASAFYEVAAAKQENAHFPSYMEYIFQLKQKAGLKNAKYEVYNSI